MCSWSSEEGGAAAAGKGQGRRHGAHGFRPAGEAGWLCTGGEGQGGEARAPDAQLRGTGAWFQHRSRRAQSDTDTGPAARSVRSSGSRKTKPTRSKGVTRLMEGDKYSGKKKR